MDNAEEAAKKAYAESGVDLPELKKEEKEDAPEQKPETKPEPKPDEKTEETPPAETEGDDKKPEDKAPLHDEPKPHKRSIYEDYKDKKSELKSEKEANETLTRENAELKQKLEAFGKAETPEEKKEAADDIEAFAKEINASPEALRKMRDLFLKDVKPATDPDLAERLKKFDDWQVMNSKAIEQIAFDNEFQASMPKLKELFPNASPEEMTAIKGKIDTMSHTRDWHDKSLAYIAFEHKDQLSALISPKKKGMESHDRKPDSEATAFEFNPEADISKMNPKEFEAWETNYKNLMKTDGLITGANGKKIII